MENSEQVVSGEFEVKLTPSGGDGAVGAMSIDKTFKGAIDGRSEGIMIAAQTTETGAAGYSALERVTATLEGKRGTFVLSHFGTMTASGHTLSVNVLEGSATGDLTGLSGSMDIRIEEGRHLYTFQYALPS